MENERQNRKFRFSKTAIEALPPQSRTAGAREQEYSDEQVTGLKILVSRNGRKFFHFRYSFGKRKRAIVIGEFPAVSVQEARERALTFRNLLSKGMDPHGERQKQQDVLTFVEFGEKEYMPYAKQNKKSWKDDENKLRADLYPTFGSMALKDISTRDIQKYMTRITERTSPSTANRHYSLISRMFNLAVQWECIRESPCRFIKKHRETGGKERFLDAEEIRKLLTALNDIGANASTCAIRFLLFSGLRMSEALTLKWGSVNIDNGQIRLTDTKAGKARTVILNELATGVLRNMTQFRQNEYVFPGDGPKGHLTCVKRAFNKAKEQAGIKEFRVHDLRHTFASLAINNGSSLFEVQKLLGHHSSQMTQRYAHLADESIKSATNGVAARIMEFTGNDPPDSES